MLKVQERIKYFISFRFVCRDTNLLRDYMFFSPQMYNVLKFRTQWIFPLTQDTYKRIAEKQTEMCISQSPGHSRLQMLYLKRKIRKSRYENKDLMKSMSSN